MNIIFHRGFYFTVIWFSVLLCVLVILRRLSLYTFFFVNFCLSSFDLVDINLCYVDMDED